MTPYTLQGAWRFLSTPSARRATKILDAVCRVDGISIHALREEGDVCCTLHRLCIIIISIHALREEGDGMSAGLLTSPKYFYPRPPRGGRPSSLAHL